MSIRSLANAKLTSWTPRTGTDSHGKPTFGTNQLSAPLPCVVAQPSRRQVEAAEREGKEVLAVINTLADLSSISEGDRLLCDHDDLTGRILEVTRRSTVARIGMRHLEMFVKEVH